jgi:hypothetical protein
MHSPYQSNLVTSKPRLLCRLPRPLVQQIPFQYDNIHAAEFSSSVFFMHLAGR